jgi:hypothetical protein
MTFESWYLMPLISSLFLLLFIIFVYALWTSSQALLPDEVNRTSRYSEQCGGNIGFFYATSPFVRVSVYDESLVIKCLFRSIKINRNALVSVDKEKGILNDSLRITFLVGQNCDRILLYCRDTSTLQILLRDIIPARGAKLD